MSWEHVSQKALAMGVRRFCRREKIPKKVFQERLAQRLGKISVTIPEEFIAEETFEAISGEFGKDWLIEVVRAQKRCDKRETNNLSYCSWFVIQETLHEKEHKELLSDMLREMGALSSRGVEEYKRITIAGPFLPKILNMTMAVKEKQRKVSRAIFA